MRTENIKKQEIKSERKKNYCKLEKEKKDEVKKLLNTSLPEDFNLKDLFWSTKSLQELIYKKYEINLPYSTVRDYLKSWFNLNSYSKGNKINNILSDNNIEILSDLKEKDVVVFLVNIKNASVIELISRHNQINLILYNNNIEKIEKFKRTLSLFKNKTVYLLFNHSKLETKKFIDLLKIKIRIKIYYIKSKYEQPNIFDFLCKMNDSENIKNKIEFIELKKEVTKRNTSNSLKRETFKDNKLNEEDFSEEEFGEEEFGEEEFGEVIDETSFIDLNNIKINIDTPISNLFKELDDQNKL